MLKNKDNIKKNDPITGAENKKKIPTLKNEDPNIEGFNFSLYFKIFIKVILKLNSIFY